MEPAASSPHVSPMPYIDHLARTIGPRPSGGAAEADAAWWAAHQLEAWGYQVYVPSFGGLASYTPLYATIYGLAALAGAGAARGARGWPTLLAALAGLALWREQTYRPLLSTLFSTAQSQNVVAILPAQQTMRQRLVVTAHLDTHHAALPLHPRLVAGFRRSFLATLAAIASIAALTLVPLARARPVRAAWLPTGYLLATILLLLHRHLAYEHVPGANDNASGVAVALALAERLRVRLTHTELWIALTGCAETGEGMRHLLDRFYLDPETTWVLNLDNVGAGHVTAVTKEGVLRRYDADPTLLGLAGRAADEAGLALDFRPYHLLGTDAEPAMERGYRAMSLMALDEAGRLPHWHWSSDTVEHVEPHTVETALTLAEGIARLLDERAAP